MNLGFQLSVFVIHLGISLLWWLSAKIRDYQTRFFRYVLLFSFAMIFTNTAYSVFVQEIISVPTIVLNIIARVNRALIIGTLFVFLYYILSKAIEPKLHRKITFPSTLFPLAFAVAALLNDVDVTPGFTFATYSRGLDFVYIYTLIVVLTIICSLIFMRKRFNKWHRFISVICAVFLSLGTIIHFFTQLNGVMETSIVLAISIAFLGLENPINKYDNVYACYKPYYIMPCINRYIDSKVDGFAVLIGFKTEQTSEEELQELLKLKKYLINQIKSVPECETFITNQNDIFVLCDGIELYKDFIEDLKEEILNYSIKFHNKANIKTTLIYVKDIKNVSRSNYLFESMNKEKEHALRTYSSSSERELEQSVINEQENEFQIYNLLLDAINEDNVEVYYLPKYSAKTNKCKSAEALLRIKNRNKIIHITNKIIRVAETFGLVMDLGYKGFEKICKFLSTSNIQKLNIECIDVNLSAVQCESNYIAELMIDTAKAYNVNPKQINFEIKLNDFDGDYDLLVNNLNKLHNYGFYISVDDFVVGDNDLMDLVKLPISSIKIDKHSVWNYFDTISTKKTVDQIIKMSHNLGISVTANGIDRKSQNEGMINSGVDYVQGPYLGEPLSENGFISLLKPSIFDI